MPINSDRPVSVVRATVVCEYVRTSDVRGRRRSSRGRGPRVLPLPVLIRRFVVVVVVVVIAVIAVIAVPVAVAVAVALIVSCRDSAVQLWWWWFRVHNGAYLVVIVVNHRAGADNWRFARRLESRSQRQQPTSRPREWRAAASRSSSLPRTSAASSRRYVTYVTLIAWRGEARRGAADRSIFAFHRFRVDYSPRAPYDARPTCPPPPPFSSPHLWERDVEFVANRWYIRVHIRCHRLAHVPSNRFSRSCFC